MLRPHGLCQKFENIKKQKPPPPQLSKKKELYSSFCLTTNVILHDFKHWMLAASQWQSSGIAPRDDDMTI